MICSYLNVIPSGRFPPLGTLLLTRCLAWNYTHVLAWSTMECKQPATPGLIEGLDGSMPVAPL